VQLAALIKRIKDNTLSSAGAKKVFEALWNGENNDVDAIIEANGLKQVSDTGALEKLVDEVLAGLPDQIAQYQEADEKKRKKLMGGFMGPLMKASKGQGNPKLFTEILIRKLGE
jgi:aspartyl-tRNA(Asn)/glutamyl-tRNA(Gln) amidotransferase subunit B